MKIVLLAENWEPRIGGIERYLKGIVETLQKNGLAVDVIGPSKKRLFWPFIKPAWLPLFIFLWRKAKRKDFQALLCGKALFEGLVGYYLKKYLGVPFVVFTYGMEIRKWSRTSKNLVKVLRHADYVIYINDVTKKELKELGVREEQLLKVQPGIQPAPTPGESASPTHAGEVARRYILSVGRLIPRKGFDVLIEAFAKLDQTRFSDVELWIVGEGPERKKLEEIAEQNLVQDSVKFLGTVQDEKLQKLYAGAEIFALTPREIDGDIEGFGIVYLEAAAYGVPAVGTVTGGVPEAVIHDKTGLLAPPDNAKVTAIALMQLLANSDLRRKLGRGAQMRVQQEFTWEKQIQPLLKLWT